MKGPSASLSWGELPANRTRNLLSSCPHNIPAPCNLQWLHSSLLVTASSARGVFFCHWSSIVRAQGTQGPISLILNSHEFKSCIPCICLPTEFIKYIWYSLFFIFYFPSKLPCCSFSFQYNLWNFDRCKITYFLPKVTLPPEITMWSRSDVLSHYF